MKDKKVTITISANTYAHLKALAEERHAGTSERIAVTLIAAEIVEAYRWDKVRDAKPTE